MASLPKESPKPPSPFVSRKPRMRVRSNFFKVLSYRTIPDDYFDDDFSDPDDFANLVYHDDDDDDGDQKDDFWGNFYAYDDLDVHYRVDRDRHDDQDRDVTGDGQDNDDFWENFYAYDDLDDADYRSDDHDRHDQRNPVRVDAESAESRVASEEEVEEGEEVTSILKRRRITY